MTSIQPHGHNFQRTNLSLNRALAITSALTLLTILFTLTSTSVHAQIPSPTLVYSFQAGTTDINFATGLLAQGRDGNIYGTGNGQSGGENRWGGIYKITPSGAETLIASFTDQGCQGLTLAFDGNFYGTCEYGGANSGGYVFQATPAGVITDIYDFTGKNGSDNTPIWVPVLGANGDLYGSTGNTTYFCGSIYRVSITGVFKYIQGSTDGAYCGPTTLSAGSDGNFYGSWAQTPASGSGNNGAIFKVTASGTYDQIFDFTGTTASTYPSTAPILAANGKLYGNDDGGGTNSNGAIFSLTTNGKTLTDLYNIAANTDGSLWPNSLLQASDGNFYGASFGGTLGNNGSFYELTSANAFSVVTLEQSNGDQPWGDQPQTPLMQHTNGLLYGTTSTNGPSYGAFVSFNIGASPFVALVGPVPSATEGTQVQILGQNFTSSSAVKFGGTAATTVQVTGSTFIEATVPTGALTGPITVTTSSGTLSTLVTFSVTPTAGSFTPTSGDVGTVVTINGTGLTQTTKVEFHGTKATSFTVVSDSEVTATVPTGATTGTISVTTKGGTATTKSKFTVN